MAVVTDERSAPAREVRWSANKKQDAVLRLLRGETLDELSRELRVEAHRLSAWRDEFLAARKEGLKGRVGDPDAGSVEAQRRIRDADRKIGELTLEVDILRAAARKRGLEIPPAKRPR